MRKDANLKSRVKNSTIYFQLGLIATMLVVLFVLEIQFKQDVKEPETIAFTPSDEDILIADYTIIERKEVVKPQNKVEKQSPKLPNEIENVEMKDDETEVKETELKSESNTSSEDVENTESENNNENNTPANAPKKDVNIFNVEQLPMFPECRGLSRSEQKACFDSQLMKAIVRNLNYPEKDLRNGNQGTALIEFVIDEKGNVVNVKALDNKRATENMQEAAKKAVKKLPKLIPAKQGNDNVRIKYTIPISFRIQ